MVFIVPNSLDPFKLKELLKIIIELSGPTLDGKESVQCFKKSKKGGKMFKKVKIRA